MNSWEMNKVIGAVLGSLVFILAIKMIVVPIVFYAPAPAKPGYVVPGVEQPSKSNLAQAPAQEPVPDFGTVLPKADAAAGQQVAQRCAQCHDWSKGGPDKIGPNLWGVLGRPRGSKPGFSYSSAMTSSHEPWTFETLFVYLKSPAAMVPGTKMSFAGLRSAQDRINLLAYLRTQSDSPLPVPPPAPKAASAANSAANSSAGPAKGAAAPPARKKVAGEMSAPATTPAAPATTPAAPATTPAALATTPANKTQGATQSKPDSNKPGD
jgi:cytochrome c